MGKLTSENHRPGKQWKKETYMKVECYLLKAKHHLKGFALKCKIFTRIHKNKLKENYTT